MSFKSLFKHSKQIHYYSIGKQLLNNQFYRLGKRKSELEYLKTPNRSEILNYLISMLKRETVYLEIGVRNPDDNFNKIKASKKYSVDPGLEFKSNPVDFKLTSDDFFSKLRQNEILDETIRFDVIFIDGLHLAEQVDCDIINALDFIKEDGFVVLHDCNPPTEWHARETFNYHFSPAGGYWNGTTWKAFMKWRFNADIHSCCIDSDSGIGILSKNQAIGDSTDTRNLFFEFSKLDKHRKDYLNLISFDDLKKILE
jgi:hypothetical protein